MGKAKLKAQTPKLKGKPPQLKVGSPSGSCQILTRGSHSVPGGRGWSPVPGSRPVSLRIWASSSCWQRWGRGRRPRAPRRPGDSPGTWTPGISPTAQECQGAPWSRSPLLLGRDGKSGIILGKLQDDLKGNWDNPRETSG